jgi:hypothetical protein
MTMLKAYLDSAIPKDYVITTGRSAMVLSRKMSKAISSITASSIKSGDMAIIDAVFNDTLHNELKAFLLERGCVDRAVSFDNKNDSKHDKLPYAMAVVEKELSIILGRQHAELFNEDGKRELVKMPDAVANKIRECLSPCKNAVSLAITQQLNNASLQSLVDSGSLHKTYGDASVFDIPTADVATIMMIGSNVYDSDDRTQLSIKNIPEEVKYNPLVAMVSRLRTFKSYALKLKSTDGPMNSSTLRHDQERLEYYRDKPQLLAFEHLCYRLNEPFFVNEASRVDEETFELIEAAVFNVLAGIDLSEYSNRISGEITPALLDSPNASAKQLYDNVLNLSQALLSHNAFTIDLEETNIYAYRQLNERDKKSVLQSAKPLIESTMAQAYYYHAVYNDIEAIAAESFDLPYEQRLVVFNTLLSIIDFTTKVSEANPSSEYQNLNSLFLSVINDEKCQRIDPSMLSMRRRYLSQITDAAASNLVERSEADENIVESTLYYRQSQIENQSSLNLYINSFYPAKLLAAAELRYPGLIKQSKLLSGISEPETYLNGPYLLADSALNYFYQEMNRPKTASLESFNEQDANADMGFLSASVRI